MTPEEFLTKYLTDRGIDLELAKALGVECIDGHEINRLMGRNDGLKMGGGIKIGDVIRPMRCPVIVKSDDDKDDFKELLKRVPAAETFGDDWRFKARHSFRSCDPGIYVYTDPGSGKTGLVQVGDSSKLQDTSNVELWQVPYYPKKAPDSDRLKVQKFLAISGSRALYVPLRVVGGRRLLIVEGSTRVLATLSHMSDDQQLDVVGLPSCWPSEDNLAELVELAKTATTSYVVLDGDVVTNPDVTRALGRIVRALDKPETKDEEQKPRDIRIGIPQIHSISSGGWKVDKVGLDDYLANKPEGLRVFLDNCLPWCPKKAVETLLDEARRDDRSDGNGVRINMARVPGSALLGARGSLSKYEHYRQRLQAVGYVVPLHPEPEGKLWKPDAEAIASIAGPYILPAIGHLRVGNEWVKVEERGLCTPISDADFSGAVDRRLGQLMGSEPTRQRHGEAMYKVTLKADVADVVPVRRSGETKLAFAELPAAIKGPLKAWEQFLARLSDRDAFLAWCHTLTMEGFRGRQAMYLKGDGHDGKTTVITVLAEALGPCSTTIDDISSRDNKFVLGGVKPRTRLVYFDDVRNKDLLRPKNVRQLIGGGMMQVQDKYIRAEVIEARPRVIIASNIQLSYSERSETTRIIQVDVAERVGPGDADWPTQLAAELPALFAAAAEAWERRHDGTTITSSPETAKVMEQGKEAVEDDFAILLDGLVFGDDRTTGAGVMKERARGHGIDGNKYQDFTRYLRERGCKPDFRGKDRKRVWVGVGLR